MPAIVICLVVLCFYDHLAAKRVCVVLLLCQELLIVIPLVGR